MTPGKSPPSEFFLKYRENQGEQLFVFKDNFGKGVILFCVKVLLFLCILSRTCILKKVKTMQNIFSINLTFFNFKHQYSARKSMGFTVWQSCSFNVLFECFQKLTSVISGHPCSHTSVYCRNHCLLLVLYLSTVGYKKWVNFWNAAIKIFSCYHYSLIYLFICLSLLI